MLTLASKLFGIRGPTAWRTLFYLKLLRCNWIETRQKGYIYRFVIWFPFPFGTQAPTCLAINRRWRLCRRIASYTGPPALPWLTGIHKSLPEKIPPKTKPKQTRVWEVERENFCNSISYHHIIIAMIMPPVLCSHIFTVFVQKGGGAPTRFYQYVRPMSMALLFSFAVWNCVPLFVVFSMDFWYGLDIDFRLGIGVKALWES